MKVDCPYCNDTGHAGGDLSDPNTCGFCNTTPCSVDGPQTDAVLRGYEEYTEGVRDRISGTKSRHRDYPLVGSRGRFQKKAYQLGYAEGAR